jgi:Mn-containing catalase
MIFDYDKTVNCIIDFLGLDEKKHIHKQQYFKPMVSIRGTQLYKKIPGHEDEIKYIEKELKEYLFDYDKYELSKSNVELIKNFNWQDEEDKQ